MESLPLNGSGLLGEVLTGAGFYLRWGRCGPHRCGSYGIGLALVVYLIGKKIDVMPSAPLGRIHFYFMW